MSFKPLPELDILSCELDQRILIEASAGTGKTWTLSTLVLRLLLEQGLEIEQILVVTFTEAATAELRSRIRERLQEAFDALQQQEQAREPLLAELLKRAGPAAGQRLQAALAQLEQARISTIHGFCQFVLQRWPLLCGSGFSFEILEDQSALIQRLLEDFWRQQLYLAAEPLQRMLIQAQRLQPRDLLLLMQDGNLGLPESFVHFLPELTEPEPLDPEHWQRLSRAFEGLQLLWQQKAEIQEQLRQAIEGKQLKGKYYRLNWLPGLLETAEQVFGKTYLSADLPERLARLCSSSLREQATGSEIPGHAFFEELDAFWQDWQELSKRCAQQVLWLQRQAYTQIRHRLSLQKQATGQYSFDDLLLKVYQALQGPGGGYLAEAIRATLPAALIDEFQDTDRLQSEIFQLIYPAQGHAFFWIGDPKQSIYRFRGADIFAYLRAAQSPGLKAYSLRRNFRSSASLLKAWQQLLSREGLFRLEHPSLPEISYRPLSAGKEVPELRYRGQTQPAWMIWQHPDQQLSAARADQLVAEGVCSEILSLLGPDWEFIEPTGQSRRVSPRQIAILTRSHRQAALMQKVLQQAAIPCLLHTESSIFASREARELDLLFKALLRPGSHQALKRALATRLLGLDAAEIYSLLEQPQHFEERLERFADYRRVWFERPGAAGLARLWQRLEQSEAISRRLAGALDAERALANLRQLLSELLQQADKPGISPQGLSDWLSQQIQSPSNPKPGLWLESEAPAVRILTIHHSKGLEFPIVFCPWLWKESAQQQSLISCFDAETGTKLVWSENLSPEAKSSNPFYQRQQLELRAESLRLCYVALTRAASRCYSPMIWQKSSPRSKENRCAWSALGYLLGLSEQVLEPEAAKITLLGLRSAELGVEPLPTAPDRQLESSGGFLKPAYRPFRGRLARPWQLNSFSRLRSYLPQAPALPLRAEAESSLPGGAAIGSFLHRLLQELNFHCTQPELQRFIKLQLAAYPELSAWQEQLAELLWQTLHSPLDQSALKLAALERFQREEAFYFPQGMLRPDALQALLQEYQLALPQLTRALPEGLLCGRLDLVFEWQQRYYVLDYKSSYLGSQAEDYLPARLQAELLASGQILQGLFYSVALHRQLGLRLPDYQPERHLGGVYYLFLRGLSPELPEAGIFYLAIEPELIIRLSQLLAGPR